MKEVSKTNPCPHCGKPDWCYSLDNLSVCKRDAQAAQGWYKTTKTDSEGSFYYALEQPKKKIRPKQTRCWYYPARDGKQLIQVTRIDDGEGGKPERSQNRWNGKRWVKGYGTIERSEIPIYRFEEVRKAIADRKPIFLVEGEPCADALWDLGLAATTNIGGSGKWQETDTADLDGAEQIILCPDRDKPGLKHMEEIAENFPAAKWLYAYPDSPFWEPSRIPDSKGLDVADWIEDYQLGADDIFKAIEPNKRNWETLKQQKLTEQPETEIASYKFNSKLNRKLCLIEESLGQHLSYNLLKKQIEFDQEPITDYLNDQGGAKLFVAQTLDMDIGDTDALAILNYVAKKSPRHPVRKYLEQCYEKYGANNNILDNFALRYFGSTESLHQTYAIKHLIASCKRIFEPGCKYDTMLILQGETGLRKSTFFKVLHGDDFFTDSVIGTEDKDSLMTLAQYWCCEYGEVEAITRKKEKEELKRFLSRDHDDYRAPYARAVKRHPRSFVFCGSANRDDFLQDETGNRRYMVIPVGLYTIPIESLRAERDRIWGAAMALYRAGVSPELTREDMKIQKVLNEDFSEIDPWQDAITTYLQDKTLEFIPTTQILEKAIGLDTAQMDKMAIRRVGAVMQVLGWKRQRRRMKGGHPWGWVLPVQQDNQIVDDLQQAVERTQQEIEPSVPDVPVETSDLEQEVETCVNWVRTAIVEGSPDHAKDIRQVIKGACEQMPELRERTWEALTSEERETFNALLTEPGPIALPGPSINWSCLPRIIEVGDSDFQELRSQLKPVRSAIATQTIVDESAIAASDTGWKIGDFFEGASVRMKSGEFLKGEYHQFPFGSIVEKHVICDRLSFTIELPSGEKLRIDAEFLEMDNPYRIGNDDWHFGRRVTNIATLPNMKNGTITGKKGKKLTILWDDNTTSEKCTSEIRRLSPTSDSHPFWKAFWMFMYLAKGHKIQALRHPDHKDQGCTNKTGIVDAVKYKEGKFLASTTELFIFNLEAVKVIK